MLCKRTGERTHLRAPGPVPERGVREIPGGISLLYPDGEERKERPGDPSMKTGAGMIRNANGLWCLQEKTRKKFNVHFYTLNSLCMALVPCQSLINIIRDSHSPAGSDGIATMNKCLHGQETVGIAVIHRGNV